jgi:hypothetical protein
MKGISPVLSTVLLVSIAVIVGVGIYYWAGSMQPRGGTQQTEEIDIDASWINATNGTVLIRNTDTLDLPATTLWIAENKSDTCEIGDLAAGSSVQCTFHTSGETITIMSKKSTSKTLYRVV